MKRENALNETFELFGFRNVGQRVEGYDLVIVFVYFVFNWMHGYFHIKNEIVFKNWSS